MRVKVHGEQRIFQTMLILLAKVVIHMRKFDLYCIDWKYRKIS